jgi:hypothetical protein
MNELAVPEQHSPAVRQEPGAVSPFRVESSIARWASEADMAWKLAENLSRTSFVPSTMRGKVGDIAGCLLAGQELGLGPMASLKSMDVIHGVVGLRAHAMRGLLQSHGHEIELIESTDTFCRMRGRRKGAEAWQESVWTIARAQKAGFVAKNPNYKTQPANMLIARATGELCRLIAADAIHGVPYTAEELRDSEPKVTAVQAGAPATAAEILARRGKPAPQELMQAADPAEEETEAVADESEPVDGELLDEDDTERDEGAELWGQILTVTEERGWTAEQTKREFEKGSEGVPPEMAPIATLQGFLNHLTGGAA